MKYKFKRGDIVRVKVDGIRFSAVVVKRLPPIADHETEPCYLLRDYLMKPPYESFREYETYLTEIK